MNDVTELRATSLRSSLLEHLELFRALTALEADLERAAQRIVSTLVGGGKLMLCGNGGSAADSQHIAAELTGRLVKDRRPLAALALTTDTSGLTCIANDYSFDEVFSRQLIALGRPGDCLLAISTSGNSRNVLLAVDAASRLGVHTIGFLGRTGGALRNRCEFVLVVPSAVTARIQEAHIFLGHTLCAMIEERMGLA